MRGLFLLVFLLSFHSGVGYAQNYQGDIYCNSPGACANSMADPGGPSINDLPMHTLSLPTSPGAPVVKPQDKYGCTQTSTTASVGCDMIGMNNSCTPNGMAAQAANALQQGAQTVVLVNQANQANGGNPSQNNICSGSQMAALANGTSSFIMGSACYSAYNRLEGNDGACDPCSIPDRRIIAQADSLFGSFKMQFPMALMNAAASADAAAGCKNQSNVASNTAPGVNPPPMPPGMPAPDQPNNGGFAPSPFPNAQQAAAQNPQGNSPYGLDSAGYPAGPGGAPQGSGKDAATIASVPLGLSSGGTGGWGTAGSGGGMMPRGGGAAGTGLEALAGLFKGKEDPSRVPSSLQQDITGPNDLTNFQKVTRMMNKKRSALKSGDGV